MIANYEKEVASLREKALVLQDQDVYAHVYFRLNSSYVWGQGQPREETHRYFDKVIAMLRAEGFTVNPVKIGSGTCPEGKRRGNLENLYCHPMDISGHLVLENVPILENAIRAAGFSVCAVDIVGLHLNMAPSEYRQFLEEARDRVREATIMSYDPGRKRVAFKFHPVAVAGIPHPHKATQGPCANEKSSFAREVLNGLIAEGIIEEGANFGHSPYPVYRTVPKSRRPKRAKKKPIPVAEIEKIGHQCRPLAREDGEEAGAAAGKHVVSPNLTPGM